MSACPSTEQLALLLSDDRDESSDEVFEHLGQCEACCKRLQQLSVDRDVRHHWNEILQTDRLAWPTRAGDDDRTQADVKAGKQEVADAKTVAEKPTAKTTPEPAPEQRNVHSFGDYELLEKIGAGGMGIVYRARNKSADRIVALKLIRPDQLESLPPERKKTWLHRFRGEAQAAARLDHEHVVTVYDVGEFRGTLYYSMQYVEGTSLGKIVREQPLENKRAARLLHSVTLAVHHAHEQGILHRDLKPPNILVRRSLSEARKKGSTLELASESPGSQDHVRERPYVADFGLAKYFEEGRDSTTHTGEVMGSPSFMSPEQARDASRCTPASDIYSLGATLYHALTGRPPFKASSPVETLRQVIYEEPVAPRELNPAIDLDLQTITLKSLAKEPARRYQSAQEMADDLQHYLRGEPIEARPIGFAERSVRWCRRNPLVASLTAGIAALLVVFAVTTWMQLQREREVSQLEREASQRERESRERAEESLLRAMDALDTVSGHAENTLGEIPGMEDQTEQILEKARAQYLALRDMQPSNAELQLASARNQLRIAELDDRLGNSDAAVESFEAAIAMFEQIPLELTNAEAQLLESRSRTMLAETLRRTQWDQAEEYFKQARQTQQQLVGDHPNNRDFRRELSNTLDNYGLLLTETGRYVEAEEVLSEAIEHLEKLVTVDDQELDDLAQTLRDLARSQINKGVLRRINADTQGGLQLYESALATLQREEADRTRRATRLRVAVATTGTANCVISEEPEKALALLEKAMGDLNQLIADFPKTALYLYEYVNACNSAGSVEYVRKNHEEATARFDEAVEVLEKIERDFPGFPKKRASYFGLKGRVYGGRAFMYSVAGEWEQAEKWVQQAIGYQQTAAQLHPKNPAYVKNLEQHQVFYEQVEENLGEGP